MLVIALIITTILSIFSTAVMSYISMATPIGPWIALTLVLISTFIFRLFCLNGSYAKHVALATCGGSIGGILATACGFSFPTLYFLNPTFFDHLMSIPANFVFFLSSLAFVAGLFGFWVADLVEHRFVFEENLAFPIGELIHKMISAQKSIRKSYELIIGLLSTTIFCALQDGFMKFKGLIPKAIILVNKTQVSVFNIPLIRFDIWPMLWAIGFVTGHVITVPLAMGALMRIIIVNPLNALYFPGLNSTDFTLAFCSGMVLIGALTGLITMPAQLWNAVKKMAQGKKSATHNNDWLKGTSRIESIVVLVSSIVLLTYLEFSPLVQAYLIIFSFICTYQITNIAGKIGLALLGRFATFVMVPAMLLFQLNMIQIVVIASFVEICGGVATDVLFGRKVAKLSSIDRNTMRYFQYFGLLMSSLCVGIFFWLLIDRFTLGTAELYAQKAYARSLLIDVKHFDYLVLFLGAMFGYLLKKIHLNPALVLGGLLMPFNISLGLITGGLCTFIVGDKERWYPFWSGVYAANSIWMLFYALF